MSGKIIIAPEYQEINGPLVFLAGPIQGAYDWQLRATQILQQLHPEINIANPRRPLNHEGDFTEQMYTAQVDWETHHLQMAAYGNAGKGESDRGAVLFWLAKEAKHFCDRAYAQTTRFELAEWKVKHERDKVNLVVGIEDGFTGARYICRRMNQDCPEVPILSTLEETCEKAVEMCYRK